MQATEGMWRFNTKNAIALWIGYLSIYSSFTSENNLEILAGDAYRYKHGFLLASSSRGLWPLCSCQDAIDVEFLDAVGRRLW